MGISLKAIEYYLPIKTLSNDDLQLLHPAWDLKKVGEKSGVLSRHIAADGETALDLACKAVEQLLNNGVIDIGGIDGIIFCTQSADYIMPSNAFLIHKHFKFGNKVWAFDYNLACSGYIYGISICRGMIETGMAKNILLITADTYSKYINKDDRSTSVLFGDGAAVTLISQDDISSVIDIQLASSGKEFESFYIPSGGCRIPKNEETRKLIIDHSGNQTTQENIQMNGFAVWKFISVTVPSQIKDLLHKNNLNIRDIDFFGFHQASKLTLDSLIKALKIENTQTFSNLENVGNTVSASIPIALKQAEEQGKLKRGDLILLSGFGVGLSWGTAIVKY